LGRAGEEAVEAGCGVVADENRDGDERPDQDWGAGQAAEPPGLGGFAATIARAKPFAAGRGARQLPRAWVARSGPRTIAVPVVADRQKW